MYTPIFALHPAGKGFPYIINAFDVPGTEEVLLHEADHILYRAFAFRIGFIADPELQVLFRTEVTECPCLNNLAIGLAGNEYGILVNDKLFWTSAKLAEGPVNWSFHIASGASIVLFSAFSYFASYIIKKVITVKTICLFFIHYNTPFSLTVLVRL
jgi:hypothetical protein